MTHTTAVAAIPPLDEKKGWSQAILVAAAILAPTVILLVLMTRAWLLLLVSGGALALVVWSLLDIRATFLIAVLLATFVDYETGHLTLEMSVLCAWFAWISLLLFWRSTWKPWVRPPSELLRGLAVWLGACAVGVTLGLLHGNNVRSLGIEVAGALWPALGLGMMQVYNRRNAVYAGLGLIAIGLVHTGFGLTMLQIYHRRLGGIYFTTVTGMVAVGLWTAALLAPNRKIRVFCLLAMIPMLAHLLFSFTRGYWLGFIVGLLLATVLSWHNLGRFEPLVRSRRLLLVPALIGIFAVTAGLSAIYFGKGDLLSSIGRRFSASFSTDLGGETVSNILRLVEWERAVNAALESPVIGKGFGFAIMNRDPFLGTTREQWFVHNYYLLIWLKLGIVGLAAFGFLLSKLIRAASRAAGEDPSWLVRAWAVTAIAVTGQVLVILLTNYSLADVNTAFAFAYIWGVFWALRADAKPTA
jgi:O-antigen ligase/polysaccharide polymerase Wzy-like membrane protein